MNLEQQKKQARELLRALRAGNPDALTRLRTQHRRWTDVDDDGIRQDIALHDAQFVIARERGFSSWPKLNAHIENSSSRHTRLFVIDVQWIAERFHGLMRTRQSAGPAALEQIRQWHPRFAKSSDEEICNAPFTEADAQLVYAREHGFETWQDLTRRVDQLAAASGTENAEPFLAAFRALEMADVAALTALLHRYPQLAQERGTNGNSLLNLAGSVVPKVNVDAAITIIELLLVAGADVNDANDRGWTALHQAGYSNQPAIAEVLLQHGADPDLEAHGSGGTPLVAALFWGHPEVADMIGSHSLAPGNLRVAAGLGDARLMEECFTGEKTLAAAAFAARGFYRPHSGFPDWHPSADRQEVLDEGLVWACKSGRTNVLERLMRAGARLDADPYRGTGLIWAAVRNRIDTAAWLIDHGATVNLKATFGGLTHGQGVTALHMAAQSGHLEMVRYLVERGADRSIRDDLHNSDAKGWADYFGQTAVRNYLRSLSGE